LKVNPFGLVPAIDDGGHAMADSNAILVYLVHTYAKGSDWMPADPKEAAEVQRWLNHLTTALPYRRHMICSR